LQQDQYAIMQLELWEKHSTDTKTHQTPAGH